MVRDLNLKAQLLPVITPELKDEFVFLNIINAFSVINNPKNANDIGTFEFKKSNINKNIIFRDSFYLYQYFCTDEFIKYVIDNNIFGISFEKYGEAS